MCFICVRTLPQKDLEGGVSYCYDGEGWAAALRCVLRGSMQSLFICYHFHMHIQWELTLTCISQLRSADVFLQESQFLVYGNGKDKPPTGLMFDKQQIKGLYFNQTPSKVRCVSVGRSTLFTTVMPDLIVLTSLHALKMQDMALAAVSMRPIPLAPIMEKLSLTPEKYGTVRRYFIQTLDDHMLSPDAQEKLVRENPPDEIGRAHV